MLLPILLACKAFPVDEYRLKCPSGQSADSLAFFEAMKSTSFEVCNGNICPCSRSIKRHRVLHVSKNGILQITNLFHCEEQVLMKWLCRVERHQTDQKGPAHTIRTSSAILLRPGSWHIAPGILWRRPMSAAVFRWLWREGFVSLRCTCYRQEPFRRYYCRAMFRKNKNPV